MYRLRIPILSPADSGNHHFLNMNFFKISALLITIFFPLLSSSCRNDSDVLSNEGKIKEFLTVALQPEIAPAQRFAALEPVISYAKEQKENQWLNNLLGRIITDYPKDPYGAYYLMAMAEGARDSGSNKLALDYLRRLLKNYPDLELEGRSLHLIALSEIAVKTNDPQEAIRVRQEMQERFPERIDTGRNRYYLAEEYRKIGDWKQMYKAYEAFIQDKDATIPGIHDARTHVSDAIKFHNSTKSWTTANLDDLVAIIQRGIRTKNAGTLKRYQSDNFFMMNWSQETSDSFTHIPMIIGSFLNNSVKYRQKIEEFSNEREAYLWTANWTWKIPTWYLYFRRIDYPADPEIHGRWEWAGIYFGERL